MTLFRKIRKDLIKKGQLKRYFLYAIGEILLVMIGISLAFQLDNWNEDRVKKNTEISYYKNIQDQIVEDRGLIVGLVNFNKTYMEQFEYAAKIVGMNDRTKMDTLGIIVSNLTQYSDFDRQGNIYETMVNSGEVKILRNHDIVNGLRLLEEKYLYINRMENIHYDAMMNYVIPAVNPNLKLAKAQIMKPDALYTYEFQNLVLSLIQIMTEKDKVYNEALDIIESVTGLIEKEETNENQFL
ncbi:DUF6090 family protein [Flagellimonas nanhaiensis]|uniref:Uncharacterized protein n=1 Tax=Flagellimonas nanhaiensis TaxID=2292706 RepID=A0A371JVU2_9FLAO|nr:DUF6090 family protein [Allomuricauda nanhaiensis]RDY61941.1 hypothetical protein DX873_07300 [Allomuricauda nanhaiensis]